MNFAEDSIYFYRISEPPWVIYCNPAQQNIVLILGKLEQFPTAYSQEEINMAFRSPRLFRTTPTQLVKKDR